MIGYLACSHWVLCGFNLPKTGEVHDWVKPILCWNVESKSNYQPLQEFYQHSLHDGYVYFPSTIC